MRMLISVAPYWRQADLDPATDSDMPLQRWTEVLRCPICALTGVACLSQRTDGVLVVNDPSGRVQERDLEIWRYVLLQILRATGAGGYQVSPADGYKQEKRLPYPEA
jgi:hypothetical protein